MSTVQVAVSFAVEIWKFHNIDLFHQGSFHIRSYFKTNGLAPVIIEAPKIWDRSKPTHFPECVSPNDVSESDIKTNTPPKAVSKSVVIIYKEESLKMYDVVEQTMHFQIEAAAIDEIIYKSDIVLVVELWFGEKKNDIYDTPKCVCERHLKVHFRPSQGLHHHLTVMFDYYYLAAVELVVHGSLVSISPCYLRVPYNSKSDSVSNPDKNYTLYQSWHSILFNTGKAVGKRHTACLIHSQICSLLFIVIENLTNIFKTALSYYSSKQRKLIEEKIRSQLFPSATQSDAWMKFAPNELEKMSSILQSQTCEEDIADQASIDITKLSSKILVLFNEFLKTSSFHSSFIESLSIKTHKLRIKRFSEAFFFQEIPLVHLLAVYDPNANTSHEALAIRIRSSPYYRRLPPLPIECSDTDGESHDQPIIFEEIFLPEGIPSPIYHANNKLLVNNSNKQNQQKRRPLSDVGDIRNKLFNSNASTKSNREGNVSTNSSKTGGIGGGHTGSLYEKKARSKRYEPKLIPVMRKLNPNHKTKESPVVEEKNVNLVGYRCLDSAAFTDPTPTSQQQSAIQTSCRDEKRLSVGDVILRNRSVVNSKEGLGTLNQLNGHIPSPVTSKLPQVSKKMGSFELSSLSTTTSLSRSMPDLSYMDKKVQLRKKPGRFGNKKSEHRFRSIYELDESQSLNSAVTMTLSRSHCALFQDTSPLESNRNLHTTNNSSGTKVVIPKQSTIQSSESQLTIFEMLASNRPGSSLSNSTESSNDSNSTNQKRPINFDTKQSSTSSTSGIVMADLSSPTSISSSSFSLTSSQNILTFGKLKANLMAELRTQLLRLYSDLPDLPSASLRPYFCLREYDDDDDDDDCMHVSDNDDDDDDIDGTRHIVRSEISKKALLNLQRQQKKGIHMIICAHGLDGEHRDLRLVRAYLSLALPEEKLEFLMSQTNEGETFGDIEMMVERLVDEVVEKLSDMREKPTKISFIGHSLGCLLVRGTVAHERLEPYHHLMYTFLSLGGPHLGTLYGNSFLVSAGLWFMQRLKKSLCLQQLALKDGGVIPGNTETITETTSVDNDPRKSLLYQMSGRPGLDLFKYVLLVGSPQDRYVPYHSTQIELCSASVKDSSEMGVVYMEMVTKLLQRVLQSGRTTVVRYDAHYTLPRSANNYIGRAAHIALIDSELFLEKFISVSAAKYFR